MKIALDLESYAKRMDNQGWVVLDRAVDQRLVDRMLEDLDASWKICREVQTRNGVANDADLTVHHLLSLGQSFLDFVDDMEPLMPYIEHYFRGKFILNSFGGAINTRGHTSYAQRVHRDIRTFSGDMPLLLNTLVMLDDFTSENGATFMMTGSHKKEQKPTDEEFYWHAEQALGAAGSILIFNSNLWHAGGNNQTDLPRRSVTPMYCRPAMKQQFDYPRALGYDRGPELRPHMRQVIGYNARVPATLEEWYQPREQRMYLPDQG
jgi:ectoine hydroxylase-related dioxygenase (phytanoyl-CoA dioxygenase family)